MPTAAAEARPAGTVVVRRARPDDAEALARLAAALDYAGSVEDMRLRLQTAEGAVFVAVDGGRAAVCGFAHVQRHTGLLAPPCARLLALVVDESARSHGIGASLLAAVERWALDAGLHDLRVDSNVVRERAHRFYQRHGYSECKRQCVFMRALDAEISPG
jgi:GNAT superfamily N-acetyltransferase